jgi:hypothetical protein
MRPRRARRAKPRVAILNEANRIIEQFAGEPESAVDPA